MIGAIIGDIAGSVYEHASVKRTDVELFPPGSRFTNDTVLTVATADVLLTGDAYDATYRRWGRRYPDAGYGGTFRRWLATDNMERAAMQRLPDDLRAVVERYRARFG